jgi:hypothetical protein
LKRSRALEAVTAVEQRMKAAVAAAAGIANVVAGHRRRNRSAAGHALKAFNACGSRSAFACATAGSHRAMLSMIDVALAGDEREADERVKAARDAMMPWSQIRCGLERRRSRFAAKSSL